MNISTPDLCDENPDLVRIVEPIFKNYGGKNSFGGEIVTVKCFEDNGLIRETLEQDGIGRVLLIDGGGSLRRALVDAEVAALAEENEWEGIVVYGCVREVDELEEMNIGIQAIASIPAGSPTTGTGDTDVPVNFGGVTFLPEDYLYADNTGVILSQEPLDVSLDIEEDDDS